MNKIEQIMDKNIKMMLELSASYDLPSQIEDYDDLNNYIEKEIKKEDTKSQEENAKEVKQELNDKNKIKE